MARAARPRRRDIFPIGFVSGGPALNPPVNSVAPVASGSPTVGSLMSVTDGTWTNSPTSYAYQWKRDAADIASATAATYTLVVADVGAMVSCRVTATNADGSASANSNTLGPVVGVFREPNANLIVNPEAINLWPTLSGVTITANAVASPEGNMTAELFTDSGGGATGAVQAQSASNSPALTASALSRYSVYCKAGTAPWARLTITGMASQTLSAYFNTATGALGAVGANVVASGADAPINGWYRFWFTFTCDATDTACNTAVSLTSANNITTILRDGTKTGHFWLAQLARV